MGIANRGPRTAMCTYTLDTHTRHTHAAAKIRLDSPDRGADALCSSPASGCYATEGGGGPRPQTSRRRRQSEHPHLRSDQVHCDLLQCYQGLASQGTEALPGDRGPHSPSAEDRLVREPRGGNNPSCGPRSLAAQKRGPEGNRKMEPKWDPYTGGIHGYAHTCTGGSRGQERSISPSPGAPRLPPLPPPPGAFRRWSPREGAAPQRLARGCRPARLGAEVSAATPALGPVGTRAAPAYRLARPGAERRCPAWTQERPSGPWPQPPAGAGRRRGLAVLAIRPPLPFWRCHAGSHLI